MTIPLWFLIVAIFLPRIALFTGWHQGWHFDIPQPCAGLAWFFVPRALVLMTIYSAQGFGNWFWIHLAAAALMYARYAYNYRTNAEKTA